MKIYWLELINWSNFSFFGTRSEKQSTKNSRSIGVLKCTYVIWMPKLFRLLWLRRSSCPSPSSEFSRGQKYLSPEVATTVESSKIFWQPIQLSGISLPFRPQMSLFGEQKHFNVIECWQFGGNFLALKKNQWKLESTCMNTSFSSTFAQYFIQLKLTNDSNMLKILTKICLILRLESEGRIAASRGHRMPGFITRRSVNR